MLMSVFGDDLDDDADTGILKGILTAVVDGRRWNVLIMGSAALEVCWDSILISYITVTVLLSNLQLLQ